MEEQLFTLIGSAIVCAPIVTGIIEAIKKKIDLEGLEVIAMAIITAVMLFGAVAYVFTLPMEESLLTGLLTGFASIGAFEGIEKTKEHILKK